jgi:uncharacterized protein
MPTSAAAASITRSSSPPSRSRRRRGNACCYATRSTKANDGYATFDEFLARFSADKRKKAKRERRRVAEAGIVFEHLRGDEPTPADWDAIVEFYSRTFWRRGREPYLNREFFARVQGIDYCIGERLQRFEPGTQGEHKIARGFVPQPTWSCHWLRDQDFHRAVASFLTRETRHVDAYMDELDEHVPYRRASDADALADA